MSLFSHARAAEVDDDPWGDLPKDLGLRWYQQEADRAIAAAHEHVRSALLVMATGLGKTQVFGARVASTKGRCLVLAHRDELVDQARQRIEQMTGEWVEIEKGEFRAALFTRIVVGSVQSLQRKRLTRFPSDHFELVVVDEAHHATAPTYRKILDHFSSAKVLGVTATPDRGDKRALGLVFDEVAYTFDIQDGIEQGYLVPVRGRRVFLEQIDLSGVQASMSEGGLNLLQLDEAMIKAVEGIVAETVRLEPDRQAVCFFPGVKSAEYAAQKFNAVKPGSAIMISGGTDPDERKQLIRDYKAGRYQYLANCMVATEGFDAPTASLIVLGRPTKSRALYAQMVGRGTRVLPGLVDAIPGQEFAGLRRQRIAASAKPDVMVLDFVGNSGKHLLASVEDVLGGKYTDAEVKAAKKKVAGGEADIGEALKQARAELAALAARAKATVKARVADFNPFGTMGLEYNEEAKEKYVQRYGHKPMDPYQRERLLKMGVTQKELVNYGRHEAKQLIAEADRRYWHKPRLATYKQLKILGQYGQARPDLTFERAHAAMDYLHQKQFRDVDPKALERIINFTREPDNG